MRSPVCCVVRFLVEVKVTLTFPEFLHQPRLADLACAL